MKKSVKIGVVIADVEEYAPIVKMAEERGFEKLSFYSKIGHKAKISFGGVDAEIWLLLGGIGKVNSAVCAQYLASEGMDVLLNIGLSGGISGISRGEIMVGSSYCEHDFDLTCFGYKLGQKPGQPHIIEGSGALADAVISRYPEIKKGAIASGDSFVNDEEKRELLKSEFGAMSCDMESAAEAYVCSEAGIPFLAIRRISDDAGSDATESYTEMNNLAESCLANILFDCLENICEVL